MAFSTWSELRDQMRDNLASGAFRTMSSYSLPGPTGNRSASYRSLKEFMDLLAYAEDKAAEEIPSVFDQRLPSMAHVVCGFRHQPFLADDFKQIAKGCNERSLGVALPVILKFVCKTSLKTAISCSGTRLATVRTV